MDYFNNSLPPGGNFTPCPKEGTFPHFVVCPVEEAASVPSPPHSKVTQMSKDTPWPAMSKVFVKTGQSKHQVLKNGGFHLCLHFRTARSYIPVFFTHLDLLALFRGLAGPFKNWTPQLNHTHDVLALPALVLLPSGFPSGVYT